MTIQQLQSAEQKAYKKYREFSTFANVVSRDRTIQREIGKLWGAYMAMHELLVIELSKPIEF